MNAAAQGGPPASQPKAPEKEKFGKEDLMKMIAEEDRKEKARDAAQEFQKAQKETAGGDLVVNVWSQQPTARRA